MKLYIPKHTQMYIYTWKKNIRVIPKKICSRAMSRHTYSRVVSKQIYLHVNIHICLYALATLGVIKSVDCVSWVHATAGGMATNDPVVLACSKPLLMKALCINFPVHDKMFASSLVRRNIIASCSFISRTQGYRDDACDIRICLSSW